jgi:predicted MPP superfamily phosphohydrolase
MFHFYITLAYIIPNIYIFFRIKDLFINKAYRRWYIPAYIILASIYLLTEIYAHRPTNDFIEVLINLSEYLLAFYLYFFFAVLLYDLFLLINLIIKVLPDKKRNSLTFKIYTLSALIVIPVVVVLLGVINLNTVRVSEYNVEVSRRNSGMDHLRVAFVSDFHIQHHTRLRFIDQFVRKVNALQPDVMLFGGDIVEGDREYETTEAIEAAFRKINSKYGSFGVPGNHEFYGGQEQGSFFRKAEITMLCDTLVKIDSSFYLAGRNDQHHNQRKSLDEILKNAISDLPIILMDHRPTELQKVSNTAVNVQFSGHTHHGQLFPVNLVTRHVYELSWGYRKIGNTHFFVTSGLRLWGPPVKTAGKSEIMLVDIHFR